MTTPAGPLNVVSADAKVVAVSATNTAGGRALAARSDTDYAIVAASRTLPGLRADSEQGNAVEGWAKVATANGVLGLNAVAGGVGTAGRCDAGVGVGGDSNNGVGVRGQSQTGDGVVGSGHRGVVGTSTDFQGVYGHSNTNAGVVGESQSFDGVFGVTHNLQAAAVSGHNPGGLAAYFDGNVVVTGDLMLAGADYAENFGAADDVVIAPGTVVVIDDRGRLRPSSSPYDRRVAGVVSGAGAFRPGVTLDATTDRAGTVPLALMGKVHCRVDAKSAPIRIGDLLTTSATPGAAMRAEDPQQAFGAVLGKALAAAGPDDDFVTVLVTLQ